MLLGHLQGDCALVVVAVFHRYHHWLRPLVAPLRDFHVRLSLGPQGSVS